MIADDEDSIDEVVLEIFNRVCGLDRRGHSQKTVLHCLRRLSVQRLGVRIRTTDFVEKMYDGQAFWALPVSDRDIHSHTETLAHEIGHWLMCPPQFRHLPEFGFGSSPEGHWTGRPAKNRRVGFLNEEQKASALGLWVHASAIGSPTLLDDLKYHFLEHNWNIKHFRRQTKQLIKMGFLKTTPQGVVVVLPEESRAEQ